jgi:hypothetical protein
MKTRFNLGELLLLFLIMTLFSGCDEYLDMTPDAEVTDKDIFGTYRSAQGYMDKQYAFIYDVLYSRSGAFIGYGDDFTATGGGVYRAAIGSLFLWNPLRFILALIRTRDGS